MYYNIHTKHNINLSTQNIWQNHWSKQNIKLLGINQSINLWRQFKTFRKTEVIINRLRIVPHPSYTWTPHAKPNH